MAGPRGKLVALLLVSAALCGCAEGPPAPSTLSPAVAASPNGNVSEAEASSALRAALAAPVDFSVQGEPLLDALPRLAEQAGVTLTIADGAVEAVEYYDSPWVYVEFRRAPLEQVLRQLIAPFDLVLVAAGDRLTVRPRIDLTTPMTTRVYPIVDLVGREGGQFTEQDCLSIMGAVHSGGWQFFGNSYIEATPGALIVSHTADVHAEVDRLLAEIRRVADPEGAFAGAGVASPATLPESNLARQLRQRVTVEWEILTVRQLAEWLASERGLTVFVEVDELATTLDVTGDGLRAPSVRWDAPLEVALDQLRYAAGLDWNRAGEAIIIANYSDRYELELVKLRVYPTADLIDGQVWTHARDVVELISSAVAPQHWDEVGGPYIIRAIPGGFVAQQTEKGHAEIASLLARLRNLSDPQVAEFIDGPLAAREPFERRLDQPTEIDWVDKPLRDGLAELFARHGIEDYYFDELAIDEAGGNLDEPVTFHLSGVTLRQAQHWLLRERRGMTWIVDDGLLWITSAEAAESWLFHRMHRLPGTLQALMPTSSAAVLDMLQEIVVPSSWEQVGGPGCMHLVPGGIVVSQDENGHAALAASLASICRLGRLDLPDEPIGGMPPEDAEVWSILERTVSFAVEDEELAVVVNQLAPELARAGRIRFDPSIGSKKRNGEQTRVTLMARDVSRSSALNLLLHPLGFSWTVDQGVLLIGDQYVEDDRSTKWCYHLPDVTPAGVGCSSQEIAELLRTCVDPYSWDNVGGSGSIHLLPGGMVVVGQTATGHQEIQRLLAHIRPLLIDRDAPLIETPPSEAERRLESALELPVGPLAADAPLGELLSTLAERREILLVVSDVDAAWRLEVPPEAASPDESLAALLDRELPPRSLGWTISDGALRVGFASQVAAEKRLYDARPLLLPRGPYTEAELLARIERAVASDDFVPPVPWGGLLVGFYPHRVHRQLQALLAAEVAALPNPEKFDGR